MFVRRRPRWAAEAGDGHLALPVDPRQPAVERRLRNTTETLALRESRIVCIRMLESRMQIVESESRFVSEFRIEDVRFGKHIVGAVDLLLAIVAEAAAI